ncbi:unnamed protein product [Rhodiola kirilowii]
MSFLVHWIHLQDQRVKDRGTINKSCGVLVTNLLKSRK